MSEAPQPPKGGVDELQYLPRVLECADKELYKILKLKAQELRYNPTKAEKILWEKLKQSSLGVKFRRQHIINRYIVDFYCLEISLVIELDGEIHEYQQEEDKLREEILESLGCKILRFKNDEIYNDLEVVLQKIQKVLKPPSLYKVEQENQPPNPLKGEFQSRCKSTDSLKETQENILPEPKMSNQPPNPLKGEFQNQYKFTSLLKGELEN